eukprot:CAMPEP_0171322674 /NCGR_PEP_ID=MMETSP0816-20121228/115107_1 /TAXON_ID=420281 /ORGANISM="Proboscia inermis, Strain CCAP1064/1" /LENGTH=32 /DNA_ID= /DNA_START= /DNA_END= /DNA_ORIENTATION=
MKMVVWVLDASIKWDSVGIIIRAKKSTTNAQE